MNSWNVYIHVPFCAKNCSYCNFSKVLSTEEDLHEQYFLQLQKEVLESSLKKGDIIKTLYFGGGTPSLMSFSILQEFLEFLSKNYSLSEKIEISLECHPSTVTEKKVKGWENLGITRVSLGIQSFLQKFDDFLDRDLSTIKKALSLLQNRSFYLSCDLIFGFPEQTLDDVKKDLLEIEKHKIQHISYYALDYKPLTKIASEQDKSLEYDVICSYYKYICAFLEKRGLKQYEIYNFSQVGQESIHNLDFWKQEDYLGFGLSSVSCFHSQIQENTQNFKKYMQGDFIENIYKLEEEELLEQYIKRALRLNSGINKKDFLEKFPKQFFLIIEKSKLLQSWLKEDSTNMYLTNTGKMYFGEVIEYLIEDL